MISIKKKLYENVAQIAILINNIMFYIALLIKTFI